MPFQFKRKQTVEFADTDMAGIAHFSNFFRYMEMTEHAFYRSLGFVIHSKETETEYGMARVNAKCQFFRPVKFQEVVETQLLVKEKREKSLTHVFVLRKNTARHGEQIVAFGEMTVVCIGVDEQQGKLAALPIPPEIYQKIEISPSGVIPELDGRGNVKAK